MSPMDKMYEAEVNDVYGITVTAIEEKKIIVKVLRHRNAPYSTDAKDTPRQVSTYSN